MAVVYIHKKPCGEIFYVGMGKANRPYTNTSRNKHWHNTVNKYGYIVDIIANDISYQSALDMEKFIINSIGLENLTNIVDGGSRGTNGLKHSKETRERMSVAGRLRANTHRRIPIIKYTLKGEFIKEYISTVEASNMTGIKCTTITENLSGRNKTAGGFIWKKKGQYFEC